LTSDHPSPETPLRLANRPQYFGRWEKFISLEF
ncbi:MAG: hypothetical protein ACI9RM_002320, partial [Ulvibacter sp.]